MRISWKTAPIAGLLLLAAGCADLEVENINNPDLDRVIAEPADLESLIASSFVPAWNAQQWYYGLALSHSVMSWEHGASWGNQGMWQMSEYPRTEWPNNESWSYYGAIEYTWVESYKAASYAAQGLRAINEGTRITLGAEAGGDQTERAEAFAHFVLGYALGTIALTYDRGFVVDENADLANLQLLPYDELMDVALGHFQSAIDISNANDFQLPDHWLNGNALSSTELAQLAHSYMARYMAEVARYPDEREAVDWASVIAHADAGIDEDFLILSDANVWWDDIKIYGNIFGTWSRANYHFWGRADISGGYEAWMATDPQDRTAFTIVTPDERYPQGATNEEQQENPGLYLMAYGNSGIFIASRGTYYYSFYRDMRYDYYGAAGWEAATPAFNTEELDLLKAEGYLRMGGAANVDRAVDLINQTRVGNGGLPAVTASGVPDGPATCVPQMPDGSCGDLFEALKHEKRVEDTHTHLGSWFFDHRGWGDLPVGTPVMAPIPAGELLVLEMDIYTFGGVGGNCAAGSSCTLPTN